MTDEALRVKIVKNIVAKADEIEVDPFDYSWLNSDQMEAFIEAWRALIQYYLESIDTNIDVEILREYVGWSRHF